MYIFFLSPEIKIGLIFPDFIRFFAACVLYGAKF